MLDLNSVVDFGKGDSSGIDEGVSACESRHVQFLDSGFVKRIRLSIRLLKRERGANGVGRVKRWWWWWERRRRRF